MMEYSAVNVCMCSKRRKRTYYYTLFSVYEKTSGFSFCLHLCYIYYYTNFAPRVLAVCGCMSACYTYSEFHGVPNPLRQRCLSVVSGSPFFLFYLFFFHVDTDTAQSRDGDDNGNDSRLCASVGDSRLMCEHKIADGPRHSDRET